MEVSESSPECSFPTPELEQGRTNPLLQVEATPLTMSTPTPETPQGPRTPSETTSTLSSPTTPPLSLEQGRTTPLLQVESTPPSMRTPTPETAQGGQTPSDKTSPLSTATPPSLPLEQGRTTPLSQDTMSTHTPETDQGDQTPSETTSTLSSPTPPPVSLEEGRITPLLHEETTSLSMSSPTPETDQGAQTPSETTSTLSSPTPPPVSLEEGRTTPLFLVETTPHSKSTTTPEIHQGGQSPSETMSTLSAPTPPPSPRPPGSPSTLIRGRTLPPPRPQPDPDPESPNSAPPSPRLPRGVMPPIPPETYRWEDVRRQRRLGGYPWAHLDKPPLGSKEDLNEHEYEIINPPPPRVDVDPPSDEKKEVEERAPVKRIDSETSSLGSGDAHFIHIPLHGDVDSAREDDISAHELQAQMEDRFFAATPETTASRTDCDVNTSQLDSSGLEDLPLRRGSRKKKEDMETQARGLQQKIRSQAGRLRAKLRSMKMPERPKFNMPERPKFNLPERPKFNLPERPKFNLPERPKFNLPERPKFNLPERPKFKLPERPKFNMPSMPSFSREKAPKKTSSTRRPLRDRANPSTESNASSSRKHFFDFDFKTYPRLFDRSRRKGGDYATSSPKSMTPPPSMDSDRPKIASRRKGPVGSRWVHRFTDIKYVDDEDARQMEDLDEHQFRRRDSPAFRMNEVEPEIEDDEELRREKIRYENEVRDAVEELDRQRQERESIHTESTTAFRDKDYDYAVGLNLAEINPPKNESIPESNREERSSGGSSGRHRAGVLEEIDSDEFFLRQKGISQEDVDMGRYLTSEIREAFRPPTNTLTQMDYDEEEEVEEEGDSLGNQYRGTPEREPIPPTRTRSLKPRKRTNRAPPSVEEDEPPNYNTFPPARPKRNRRQQEEEEARDAEDAMDIEAEEPQDICYEEEEEFVQRGEDEWQDISESQPPPAVPKRVRRSRAEPVQHDIVPEAQRNGHVTHDDWRENIMPQEVVVLRMEPDYIIPGEPEPMPVAPKRERRRTSSRAASLHSLAEDRTSRAADSLPRDDQDENILPTEEYEEEFKEPERYEEDESEMLSRTEQEERHRECPPAQLMDHDYDLGDAGGYATVEKIYPVKPPRPNRPKPPRPPAPVRRKRLTNHFFSLPRKNHTPPIRPLRNYSTLGPSRPSRRERARKSEPYVEIKDDLSPSPIEDSHASNREDLKSGDVIEKMKGRPLPAPPRPPRKTKEAQDEEAEVEDNTEAEPTISQPDTSEHALGALNDAVFYSAKESIAPVAKEMSLAAQSEKPAEAHLDQVQEGTTCEEEAPNLKLEETQPSQTAEVSAIEEREAFLVPDNLTVEPEPFEEVTVATQTDPLPDDFCMDVEEEPPEHADACTETTDIQPRLSDVKTETVPVEKTAVNEECASVRVEAQLQQAAPVLRRSTPPPPPPPTIIEREVPVYIMPDKDTVIQLKAERLQVADLDVERLNVGELQAQKILVSDIDGVSMQVAELYSKSGKLFVNGIELPPGFLQELYDSIPRPQPVPQSSQSVQTSEYASQPTVPPRRSSSIAQVPPSESVTKSQVPQSETISQPTAPQSESISQQIPQTEPTVLQSETISTPQSEVISQPPLLQSVSGPQLQSPQTESIPKPHIPQSASVSHQQNVLSQPPTYSEPPSISPSQPFSPAAFSGTQSEPIPPSIPPPPLHIPMDPRYSYIPSAMRVRRSQIQDLESEEELISFIPSTHRRRRHHVPKPMPRYSTDEEEEVVSFQPRRHPQRSDPSVMDLSRQLGQAVTASSMRALRSIIQYTTTQLEGEDKRRELQTVLCILLILVAGLILMGFGTGKVFHHHHWDYLNPPK